jgi:dihydroxyacetone synthase
LKLNNLIVTYDNNSVTCDGPLDWINSEDINEKMRACGWYTIDVMDGAHNVQGIVAALAQAKLVSDKPVFINIRTVIGVGTLVAGTAKAHHGLFDKASIETSKRLIGLKPQSSHTVPDSILKFFRERKDHGEMLQREWNEMLVEYTSSFPDEAKQALRRMGGELDRSVLETLSTLDSVSLRGLATRETNGIILEKLWELCPAIFGGGADLVNSNKVRYNDKDVFHPATGFQGRYIRYGIREHAMCAISNGLAGFSPGAFIPVTATFLMFYIYVSRYEGCYLALMDTDNWKGSTWSSHGCPFRASGNSLRYS